MREVGDDTRRLLKESATVLAVITSDLLAGSRGLKQHCQSVCWQGRCPEDCNLFPTFSVCIIDQSFQSLPMECILWKDDKLNQIQTTYAT